ncbi:MAG: RDD family protein [Acidimicrobiales bacterium]
MSPQNPIDRLFGAVVPRAVDAVDIESVIEQVDIDKLVSEVDLDRVLEGVDLQKLLERIDLDALLQRIDLDALLVRLDLDALVSRLDLNTLISGVDIDGLIQRVDVDGLIKRVDVDGIVQVVDVDGLIQRVDVGGIIKRVDVDGIIQEVDIDGLIGRVDMPALMKRAQIDVIVSNASRGVFTRVLDALRRQLAGLDLVLIGVVNRVFRRPRELDTITDGTVTGRLAGGISRLAAFAIDAFTIAFSYGVMVAIGMFLVGLFMGRDVTADHAALWYALGYAGYGFFYYWIGLLLTGRSIGKGLIGLRVVGPAGVPISPRRAAIRTLVYPLSFILWIGLIPIVTGKRRRALHDWAAGSTVVYDWGDRPSELPAPVTDWLRRHDVDASRPRTVPAVSSVAVVSSNGTAASAATGTPGDTIDEAPTVDTPTSANP